MEFALHYRGDLKGNGSPKQKQQLRRHFHAQLLELWKQKPLVDYVLDPSKEDYTSQSANFIRSLGQFQFVPLVNEKMDLIADLEITMLRPEPPGSIITQTGDIDNRLKTLFDALRMPQSISELPSGDKPGHNEDPFYCVLEDDNLIQKVSVATDRLLEPVKNNPEVELLVKVKCKVVRATMDNIGIGL